MRQHQETTYDRATAIVDAVNDAEIVIAKSIQDSMGRARYTKEKAHAITQALDEAGFEIRYRPIDIVPETPSSKVRIHVPDEASERKLQDLLAGKSVPTGRVVEVTQRMPDGSIRTQRHAEFGQIDKVSYSPTPVVGSEIMGATVLSATEKVDLPAEDTVEGRYYELTPKAEAVIRAFTESVALTQDAITAGSDALEREIEGSFAEPLNAAPDEMADQRDAAEAIRCVVQANLLLAMAADVLGGEAVDVLMQNLAVPDTGVAA